MKHLSILEIQLLSQKEKRARKITFDPVRTVIQGKNQTGKSSLIKSIYRTFGAEVLMHVNFKAAQTASLVKFTVDQEPYQMLRDGDAFAIYDGNGELIRKFDSVTNELAPFMAELFNFKPLFETKNRKFIIPPPAFLFLPFYVDQDASWQKSWNAFERLAQFKGHRAQSIYYHSGIRPNEYYETKKQIESYLQTIAELEKEEKITSNMLREMHAKMQEGDFNIDAETFKEQINHLLIEAEKLKLKEEQLKQDLLDLYQIKSMLQCQSEIVKTAILENHRDLNFASDILEAHVDCPLCGAHYENSFAERFAIANDEKRSQDLLLELNKELAEVEKRIEKENDRFIVTTEAVQRIEAIMHHKQGEIQLKDVIESSGKNQVRKIFSERIRELTDQLVNNTVEKEKLVKKLKALENRKHKTKIIQSFREQFTQNLKALDIASLTPDDYKQITVEIEKKETGSSRPRALIAYYYAFFEVMKQFSTTTYCPIIIDSPNQQDQDIEHIDKIMQFINDKQPENSQMILGIAENYGVDFNSKVVMLTEKFELLKKEEYDEMYNELFPKLGQLWMK